MNRNAYIKSTGMYVPERIVPNSYFDELLGEDVSSWLAENVQIYERRWCSENESTADLCIEAAKNALQNASLEASNIDLLIIATDTPEYISPSTASKVQYLLGMTHAGSFDVNTACAGFVTALDMATKYIKADQQYQNVMVIGAYAMSKYLNMTDKKTVTLFADAAGAVILSATESENQGFLASELITKGEYYGHMGIYAGGTYQPITEEVVAQKDHLLKFVTKFPKTLNPEMWSMMAANLNVKLGISADQVDHYLLTQININSIFETMDRLGVSRAKAPTVMHHYGYTGSACIPLALHESITKGKVKRGDLMYFIGSGGGLAFASAAFRY
ncbi:MAG: ketoacyl-ACP synthase III [Bacteroidetes bacterium]|nr:ketoacyl-ACP synthase III [Bacteroidota bacterium]MBU1579233.1 ketoacyl-ACP synthase III [Bacteroidota bacterium]MBU2557980.1 ketoacyl-ACP synthase III [Bacteroidota bacterium]